MIEIKIPRDELIPDFMSYLAALCGKWDLQAHVTILDVLPVPVEYITVDG